ncbi:MAG: response regulator [Gemmatimonadetes bacterium]|nr:response regulator [Gemmatimonadota bacterium]
MSDSASDSVFRILLVEDAPDQSLLLSAVLQRLGPFDVTLVQDGVQALELARGGDFDLVLTDLNLPGIDGAELTRRLKEEFPDLPVLAATGYTDPAYADGAYRAGVDALMTKPVDPEDLEARLRELLPRWRTHDGPAAVLAVGAAPGEIEMGCGGSLAAHHAAGHHVVLVIPHPDADDERAAARLEKAAENLGAGVVVTRSAEDMAAALTRLSRELLPQWAYLPSAADREETRREIHTIARAALANVPTLLGYAGPGTSLDFAPDVFRDVGGWMDAKLGALAFHHGEAGDPATSPDFAIAHARYWGRFNEFGEVEPFELLDGRHAAGSHREADSDAADEPSMPPPWVPPHLPGFEPLAPAGTS